MAPPTSDEAVLPSLKATANEMKATTSDAAETKGIKVENCIGFTKVPLGLAGPLTVHGESRKDTIFAPLATTEATLVASCSRGSKAIESSGGAQAVALANSMARAPIFHFPNVKDAVRFYRDVPHLFPIFQADAEKTSRRAKLLNLTPHIIGSNVHVKFDYATGDSTGQNMTTFATHTACTAFLASPHKDKYALQGFDTEGQFASDKKLAWGNVTDPRGVRVIAWANIPDDVCKSVLGNSARSIYEAFLRGLHAGIRNGMIGYNINTANVLAAIFIATGQDAASVLEGGWSQLTLEFDDAKQELVASLYFPSLPVGTAGGGTVYPTQREALKVMKCDGDDSKSSLAEKIASFALALEISTLSAITNDTFSQSHQRLARAKL